MGLGFWGLELHAEDGGLPQVLPLTVHLTFLVGGLQDFSVSPSPLWANLGFKLGWTGLGLGLGGSGTKGFGVGD